RAFVQAVGATTGDGAGNPAGFFSEGYAMDKTAPVFASDVTTRFQLNGRTASGRPQPRVSLLDLPRARLQLTGAKKGGHGGACGACTVLLDGQRVNACMTLAASCDGREVRTIEGLAGADSVLDAVQQAFIDADAFQCGYCTPGQIVSAFACIKEGHTRSPA